MARIPTPATKKFHTSGFAVEGTRRSSKKTVNQCIRHVASHTQSRNGSTSIYLRHPFLVMTWHTSFTLKGHAVSPYLVIPNIFGEVRTDKASQQKHCRTHFITSVLLSENSWAFLRNRYRFAQKIAFYFNGFLRRHLLLQYLAHRPHIDSRYLPLRYLPIGTRRTDSLKYWDIVICTLALLSS